MNLLNQGGNNGSEVKPKSMRRAKLLEGLEDIAYPIEREAGSILLCEGECGGIFLLCRGKARLTMYSRTGEKLAFRTVGPGYLLGLPASMRNKPYNFTAELLQDSQVAFIRNQDIPTLLRRRGDLCFRVVETLSHELRRLQQAAVPRGRRARRAVLKVVQESKWNSVDGNRLIN
ncbi:MAG TPA: cyclic nucleotide-binding domain-containing protein [Terriglobales bacterium]|nr:cyclic nucleotide-binding domain-containing protein [Terriglobales bacterium]